MAKPPKKKIFQNAVENAQKKGVTNFRSTESIKWFRNNIRKSTRSVSAERLFKEEKDSLVNSWTNVGIGKMYFATYDPKHKKTLPYYDTFPLIIPIDRYKDGILGLNLHYLPPILRAKLLDALYDNVTNPKIEERRKMKINYGILSAASKYSAFQPCVKRYLGKHFRSRFIQIHPDNWTPAVFLPVENFQKASKQTVWGDSRKLIK